MRARNAVFCVLLAYTLPIAADDWMGAQSVELESPNGLYVVRIDPGSADTFNFKGERTNACRTDAEKNEWLTACAWAAYHTRQPSKTDVRQDPWAVLEDSNRVFEAEDHLAERFVDTCFRLREKPVALPQEKEDSLIRLGWPRRACPREVLTNWLATCVLDAEALRPGTSRRILLESFRTEGGISSPSERNFIHKRCGMLKIRVTFSPAHGETGDSEHADDDVETVLPFIGFFFPG